MEYKDLADITTKLEICQVFDMALNILSLNEIKEKSLRKVYGETQSTKISLPAESAVCRVREVVYIKCRGTKYKSYTFECMGNRIRLPRTNKRGRVVLELDLILANSGYVNTFRKVGSIVDLTFIRITYWLESEH